LTIRPITLQTSSRRSWVMASRWPSVPNTATPAGAAACGRGRGSGAPGAEALKRSGTAQTPERPTLSAPTEAAATPAAPRESEPWSLLRRARPACSGAPKAGPGAARRSRSCGPVSVGRDRPETPLFAEREPDAEREPFAEREPVAEREPDAPACRRWLRSGWPPEEAVERLGKRKGSTGLELSGDHRL
jgi:hypothetical protein